MYNYSQGYTVGGGMGNIGAYGGMIDGINNLMAAVGPDQQPAQGPNTPVKNYDGQIMPFGPGGGGLPPTPQASMFGGPQMGQSPTNPMIGGFVGNFLQAPYQNMGLTGQLLQGLGGFQSTAGGNVGGLSQDQYPAKNSGFLNKRVS